MAEEQSTIKTKGLSMWHWVAIGVLIIIGIWFMSKVTFNAQFFVVLAFLLAGYFAFLLSKHFDEKKKTYDVEEILNKVMNQFPMIGGEFLDPLHAEVKEVSPDTYKAYFPINGITFEFKQNKITGMERINLYDSEKEREKSRLYDKIIERDKRETVFADEARKIGLEVGE